MRYLLLVLALTGCMGEAQTETPAGNDYNVGKLFTVDGCTVYRFWDGRFVYFTNCNGQASYNESCGKNCERTVEVD